MDYDSFLSLPRWQILEIISTHPSSPIEISSKLGTSVSYVSQQLKLLEAANLVKKERTGQSDKGKPRMLFSLSREILYFKSLTREHPIKKLIHLSDFHKIILNIWVIEDQNIHHLLQKLYYNLEDQLDLIEGIFFDDHSSKSKVIIISESKLVKNIVETFFKKNPNYFGYSITNNKDFYKNFSGWEKILFPIYISSSFENAIIQLKGGSQKNE